MPESRLQPAASRRPASSRGRSGIGPATRTAFTLIELVVVIAIIAVVIGTVFVTLGSTLDRARDQEGKVALNSLDAALSSRQSKFALLLNQVELGQTSSSEPWFNVPLRTSNLVGGYDSSNTPTTISTYQARGLILHDMYRGLFPQRLEDLLGLDGATANQVAGYDTGDDDSPLLAEYVGRSDFFADKDAVQAFVTARAGGTLTAAQAAKDELINSELLWLQLFVQPGLPGSRVDGTSFKSEYVLDTDEDGIPELFDPYGQRLHFYNAPTRMVRPGGAGTAITASSLAIAKRSNNGLVGFDINAAEYAAGLPQTVAGTGPYISTATHPLNTNQLDRLRLLDGYFNAPFDVEGYFGNPGSVTTTLIPLTEQFFWTRNTAYQPLIISAGVDGLLGFELPNSLDPVGASPAGAARLGYVDPGNLDRTEDNLTNRKRVLK